LLQGGGALISEEEVRVAYRRLLGRDAESDEVVAYHAAQWPSIEALHRAFVDSAEFQFRMLGRPLPTPTKLRTVPMPEVCRLGVPIRLLEPDGTDGNVSFYELVILNHLVAQRAPTFLFEFGTFDGRTTLNLAANAPDNAMVYTIDLPRTQINGTLLNLVIDDRKYIDKECSGLRFAGMSEVQKIVQVFGDTAAFDFSQWYNKVDFIFIDASHSAPYVRNDTEVALRLIGNRNGLIVWHDYGGWPGVTEVLEDYQAKDARLGQLVNVVGTSLALCELCIDA
jgi:predicted O-methyltransferase YrrM